MKKGVSAIRLAGWSLLALFMAGFRPVSTSRVSEMPNVAIKGYDPVAYFTENRAVRGRPVIHLEWEGALWFFASKVNQRLFEADPEKYVPAYGGFCAYCVAESGEAVTGGDPEIFLIHKDRLFLLQSESMRRQWLEDIDGHTETAAKVYAQLRAAATPPQS